MRRPRFVSPAVVFALALVVALLAPASSLAASRGAGGSAWCPARAGSCAIGGSYSWAAAGSHGSVTAQIRFNPQTGRGTLRVDGLLPALGTGREISATIWRAPRGTALDQCEPVTGTPFMGLPLTQRGARTVNGRMTFRLGEMQAWLREGVAQGDAFYVTVDAWRSPSDHVTACALLRP